MKKNVTLSLAIFTWIVLITQLSIIGIIKGFTGDSFFEAFINFLSFFPVETNLAVAMILTVPMVVKSGSVYDFFVSNGVRAMVVVYSFMVVMIFDLVLQDLWEAEGMQFLLNYLMHKVIPIFYIIYWFNDRPRAHLKYSFSIPWLIAPVIYLTATLIRGHLTGYYPYPFIDVDRIGMATVLYNSVGMLFLFWLASILLIWIDRRGKRTS
jgi:hypothetical protein